MRLTKLPLLALFTLAAACAKPAPTGPSAGPGDSYSYSQPRRGRPAEAPAQAPSADGSYYGGSGAAPAPSAALDGRGYREEKAAKPKERPGLGTSFGETRSSHVREEAFERASYDPFAALAIYYNDAEGIAAQVAYQGGIDPYPLTAYTPHGGISVALESEYGYLLEGVQAGGRTYVVGQDGERYSIVVRNLTGGRYEVVASVDGLDVIDGTPAALSKRGYLLEPYGTLTIDGFRTSGRTVAAFRFGSVKESYAARTSGDRNVGVIGLAFFAERGSPWTTDELHRRESADPFPAGRPYAKPPRY